MEFPGAGDRHRHRAQEPRADQDKLAPALAKLAVGGSVLPRAHRRRDGADDHRRHGRAAPGDHRRPAAARVQGRGQRRQAAGRLPRDHHQAGGGARASTSGSRAASGMYGHIWLRARDPTSRARASTFKNTIVGGKVPREFVQAAVEKGVAECDAERRARRLPHGGREGASAFDGELPRRRTPTRWRSRSPARMAFKDGLNKAGPGAARADDELRGRHPGGLHGRRDRRLQRPPRQGARGWARAGGVQVINAQVPLAHDVRLRDRRALADPGPGDVHDAVQPLRPRLQGGGRGAGRARWGR